MLQNPYDPSFGTEDVSFIRPYSHTCVLSACHMQSVVHFALSLIPLTLLMPDWPMQSDLVTMPLLLTVTTHSGFTGAGALIQPCFLLLCAGFMRLWSAR